MDALSLGSTTNNVSGRHTAFDPRRWAVKKHRQASVKRFRPRTCRWPANDAGRRIVHGVLLPARSEGPVSDGDGPGDDPGQETRGGGGGGGGGGELEGQHPPGGLLSSVYQAPGSMASFLRRSVEGVFSSQDEPGAQVSMQAAGLELADAASDADRRVAAAAPQQPQVDKGAEKGRHQEEVEAPAEGDTGEQRRQEQRPAVDISAFLQTSGTLETRYMRMLASLCALTYLMPSLTPRRLQRMHQLELITTSRACELLPPASEASEAGTAEEEQQQQEEEEEAAYIDPCMGMDSIVTASCTAEWDVPPMAPLHSQKGPGEQNGVASNITPLSGRLSSASPVQAAGEGRPSSGALAEKEKEKQLRAAEIVSRKLGEAAAAAAALGGRAGSAAAAFTIARRPFARSVAKQLEHAAEEGGGGAAELMMMTHGVEMAASALSGAAAPAENPPDEDEVSAEAQLPGNCPCEWFVADDPVSNTRYFVIQGSDNLESWITNVTFDPVPFEGPELGVKVHRGVYRAALTLYDRFLPLVRDHLEGSPFATVSFTGHSLGGALATVLLLMFTSRGVLRRSSISPVYTFGGAAVFCETGGAVVTEVDGTDITASQEEGATATLLERLGLGDGAVRNVVLNNDIVPRAFACDYSLVASILGSLYASFREHHPLHSARGVLYSFVGRLMVLQPDPDLKFASPEGSHPMLPEGAGLYTLRSPTLLSGGILHKELLQEPPPPPQQQQQQQQPVTTLSAAVMAFMDHPHPLDTLADHRAYGTDGSISRYHNPDHYTQALGAVLRCRRQSNGFADQVTVSIGLQQRALKMMRGGLDSIADTWTEFRRRRASTVVPIHRSASPQETQAVEE